MQQVPMSPLNIAPIKEPLFAKPPMHLKDSWWGQDSLSPHAANVFLTGFSSSLLLSTVCNLDVLIYHDHGHVTSMSRGHI